MKICKEHWQMMHEAVKSRGLWELVSKSGEEAIERTVSEMDTGDHKANFDPLMSMHWHWTNEALRNGGLYLMGECDNPKNDNQYCPVCEYVAHVKAFDAQKEIDSVADQMRKWCLTEGMIPKAS